MRRTKAACVLTFLCATALGVGLASCVPGTSTPTSSTDPGPTTYEVTYLDGSTVLHTENVEEGEKAPNWDPATTVTNKEFFGWYGEPTLTHEFDFDTLIDKDTSIFGSFVGYEKDTRKWALAGSGASSLLKASNWGKVFTENHYMKDESTSTHNVYTMELNLFANDQFQFTNPILNEETNAYSWGHQRGGGYLADPEKDGTKYFSVGGGLGDDNYTSNITAHVDGLYKLTLKTYPAGDFQKGDSPETYNNRNYYDTLTWERLGDATEVKAETTTTYFMKGALITNWANLLNDHTKMVDDNGVHKLNNVYLKTDDEFMFASVVTDTATGETSEGNEYIRATNLTESSKALITGTANMKVVENGYYNFAYDAEAKTLDVTKATDYVAPVAYYYADGNFGGRNWGIEESLKLVQNADDAELYELANPITVTEAGQQLGIQFYNADLEKPYVDFFGSGYVAKASESGEYDLSKTNISFSKTGSYNISLNTYSHIITITAVQ